MHTWQPCISEAIKFTNLPNFQKYNVSLTRVDLCYISHVTYQTTSTIIKSLHAVLTYWRSLSRIMALIHITNLPILQHFYCCNLINLPLDRDLLKFLWNVCHCFCNTIANSCFMLKIKYTPCFVATFKPEQHTCVHKKVNQMFLP